MALGRSAALVAALAAALAGCDGGGGGGSASNTTSIKPTSAYVDRLRALSELNRGLALRRAVQDWRHPCKKPESSGYQQDFRNLSMWTIRCTGGRDYGVFIAPNGDVQVRRCDHLEQLDLPKCRFEESAG